MTGIDDRLVGQFGQCLQAFVHLLGIGPGQVGTSTSVEEERVARDETTTGEKALAARRVSGGVNERDVDFADRQGVAGCVCNQM